MTGNNESNDVRCVISRGLLLFLECMPGPHPSEDEPAAVGRSAYDPERPFVARPIHLYI